MSESTTETTNNITNDITNVPEAAETATPEPAAPAETRPAENLPAGTGPETGAESEPRPAASSGDAAHEAELAARRAAVLAGDYSAWSPDLSLSDPAPVVEPQEKPPSPEAIEAVKRIGRDHHAPAAIGRNVVFHGDGYPVRGVIIGAEGNSLAIRVEGGMECLVPPDIQIQYLDTRGLVIWTSTDLQGQESASEQPPEPEQPPAAGQADPDQAGQDVQGGEQPGAESGAARQPEGPEDSQDAAREGDPAESPHDAEPEGSPSDTDLDDAPVEQLRGSESEGEPLDQSGGSEPDREPVDQARPDIEGAADEGQGTDSQDREPEASAETPEAR